MLETSEKILIKRAKRFFLFVFHRRHGIIYLAGEYFESF